MQKTIHFHVGAHKTATTYMQSRLRANREHLRGEGVDFIDLWARTPALIQYRAQFRRLIERDVADERKILELSEQLRAIVEEGETSSNSLVVLSYENILGGFDLTQRGAPYPNAAIAIRHIIEAFPDRRVKIFLSIRSLDRFLESGYLQRVTTRRETRTFKQYFNQVDVQALSWVPLVRAVKSLVEPEDFMLWDYESFFSDEWVIWNALLNIPNAQEALVNPAKKSNYSLSAKGLKYMRSVNKVATAEDAKKFRSFVKQNFGCQTGLKSPKLLGDAGRRQLIEIYERDRKELAGLYDEPAIDRISEGVSK